MKKRKRPGKGTPRGKRAPRRGASQAAGSRRAAARPFAPEVRVSPDLNLFYHDAADLFLSEARKSVYATGRFTVALSGGSTPREFFALLSREPFRSEVSWEKTLVLWGDERHVPRDHPDSNFRLAWDHLLSRVPVPRDNLYPMSDGKGSVARAAAAYEKTLKSLFGSSGPPRLDFNLMGLGTDGHTASLFPGKRQILERRRWVVGYRVDSARGERISLTFPVFNRAELTVVLVEGEKKADILRRVLEGPSDPPRYPVQRLRPEPGGRLLFLLDSPAASKLSRKF